MCLFTACLFAIAGFAGPASAQTTVLATPSSLAFGDVELNSIRQASVQIAVIGDAQFQRYELDTAAFGADGPFTLSNVDCPVAGGSGAVTEPCSLSIRFAPTRSGPATFSRDLTYTIIYRGELSTRQVLGTVRVAANGRGVGNDADSDGVYDDRDECANTPRGERADERGCGPSQRDTDGDEVTDDRDECANTPRGERADERGCGPSQRDTDSDEVTDDRDECANTPRGERADERGCGPSQRDTDGDEVTDDRDECANTPRGERADERGCGPSQRDTDSDEVTDDRDECANTPRGERADERGCGPSQRDTDGDEVTDDRDECANTPRGERADERGCGPSQRDTDSDEVTDDRDECANTPRGERADERGCGPSQRDTDSDEVTDDRDECANTPRGERADERGCGPSQRDTDSDEVTDDRDECANTPRGERADERGCGPSQRDTDSDEVNDDRDECANTPRGERADERGCGPSQRDTDSDEVTDDRDECPNTPRGARVDSSGCPLGGDADDDGVGDDRDECANTPAGERADERGCGPSQRDTDSDEVNDDRDECANTPAGEQADERGCGPSQRDSDDDEVNDDRDECPNTPRGARVDSSGCPLGDDADDDGVSDDRDECANTPAGEQADERGCGLSQRDSDDDEVNDDRDECANTPAGEQADERGCGPSQRDSDDDEVNDDRDECANTPAGEQADERGCGPSQRDSDDDGVNDADDRCPDVAGSNEDGCPNEDEEEDKLRDDLTPFTGNDPALNQTRDVIADSCTSERASEALQEACEELVQAAASDDTSGIAEALREITPEKATKGNVAVRQNNRVQNRNLGDRMIALRSGVRGVSLRGLTASLGDYRSSVEDIVQMIADAIGPLGGGAGELEDTLLSGSRWGYFLSGELSKGDKDETARTSGFDFENRVITTGIDYRLRDNLILGAAVSFLDGENDIDRDGGSLDSDGHAFSLYGTWYRENLFVDLSVSLGAMEYEQSRRIVYQLGTRASVDNRFDAKYDGDSLGVFAGFGWNLIRKQWNINLRATFDYLDSDLDAFTETARSTAGAGWAVFLDKQNQSWLTGTATATASYVFTPRWGVMIPFIEVDLVHEFDNDPQALTGRFLGDLQGQSLSVLTDDPDRDYVRVRAGASVQLPGGFAAFADYGRLFAFDNWGEHTISAGIRYEF